MNSNTEHWAELSRCDSESNLIAKLTKSKYTIGRGENCDFKFPENKFLSQTHCYIEQHATHINKAWLIDDSTNGSLINLTKKIHKERYLLEDEDKICIVRRKNDPGKNISFLFQYRKKNQQFEATLAYDCTEDLNLNTLKRSLSQNENDNTDTETKEKKIKNEEIDETVVSKKTNIINNNLDCPICDELIHDCVSL
jgi:hypothetical protein